MWARVRGAAGRGAEYPGGGGQQQLEAAAAAATAELAEAEAAAPLPYAHRDANPWTRLQPFVTEAATLRGASRCYCGGSLCAGTLTSARGGTTVASLSGAPRVDATGER